MYPVRDLLLQRAAGPLGLDHLGGMHHRDPLGERDVAGDPDEAAELPESEGQLTRSARAALGLADDLDDRLTVEVGDLLVLHHFLGDEPDQLHPVLGGVGHRRLDIQFVPVPPNAGPEGRVHGLDAVDVAGRDQDEVRGHRLGLDHRSGGALGLADDGELPLLEGGEQRVLALDLEQVDLVDEEDAAVRLVDRPDLNPFVGRRFEAAGLERVVLHVAEERPRVGAGGVDERGLVILGVGDQELCDVPAGNPSVRRRAGRRRRGSRR